MQRRTICLKYCPIEIGGSFLKRNFNLKKKIMYLYTSISHMLDHDYVEKYLMGEGKLVFHNGELYPDKIIYFIDLSKYECGFFAQYRCILAFLNYADKMNYVPVIKMNTKMYNDKGKRHNVYDDFFQQPTEILFENLKEVKNIIYSDFSHLKWLEEPVGYILDEKQIRKEAYLKNKYVCYNKDIINSIKEEISNLFSCKNKNVLGVHIRGGDYFQEWKGHPKPIQINEYVEYIEEALKTETFEKIFLATDDDRCMNAIKEIYNEKVLCYNDVERSSADEGVHYHKKSSRIGYEVLRDMYTLSQCGGLIAGKSQVSTVARVEKYSRDEEYSYLRIIDKGLN